MRTVPRLGLLLALCLSMSGCESEPRNYEFTIQTVGGPEGWPVWVETLTFDHTWSGPNGDLNDGFGQYPPASDSYYSLGAPLPAPQSMQARWFSYRTQTFYEIDLTLPETEESFQQWYREYPLSRYRHAMSIGLSGQGEVQIGWLASCRTCPDQSEDFYSTIVPSAQGKEIEGEALRYRTRTEALIEKGAIPSPW